MRRSTDRLTLPIAWLALLPALTASAAASTPAVPIANIPNVQLNAAKVDASGNIFVAGQTTNSASSSAGASAAYLAKLSPNGTIVYSVTIGGSGSRATAATALDIDSAGDVYAAGSTTASDFPVSSGAIDTPGATAFAAKLDPNGKIVYAALIGGKANTQPSSVVVNSKKELLVSGYTTTPPPAGAETAFLLKLSADGTQAAAGPQGIGGLLAIDPQDNVYVAGNPPPGATDPPATAGAFQSAPAISFCGCPFLSFPCGGDQFVASLTPDLSGTRFLTYITAHFGAIPASIAVDAQGNILVAGTTYAPAYPTTPNAFEPVYTAASGIIQTCGPPVPEEITSPSGYVTLVKADGSGLIFSTFFSGSNNDYLRFAALTSAGIYLAGQAGSPDLPGFDGAVPSPCVPLGYVTRMTLDGSSVSLSRTPPGTPLAYDSSTGTLLLAYRDSLLRFDPSQSTPIACVVDAADLSPVTSVAPGELLTMLGRFQFYGLEPSAAAPYPVNGSYVTSAQGLAVTANQSPTPLLYESVPQINFQAPYEIANSAQTDFTVTYTDVNGNNFSDSRSFNVAAMNPVAFLTQPSLINGVPLVLNSDGSVNSQKNPALAGSVVTLFLDGLGVTTPPPVTGSVNSAPSVPLNLPLTVTPICSSCNVAPTVVSAGSLAGSISGVTQVQLRAPANPHPGFTFQDIFSLSVGSTAVRDINLFFWVD